MSTPLAYLGLVAAILLGIGGQIALKSAAVGAASLTAQLFNPLTFAGLVIYALASIGYIIALNRIPVSIAFPSVAASYAIIAVLAHYLWNEPLAWQQVGGIALIAGGIILIHQT
ncbi:MAG TPA: EamA family transporter [Stellaceae bacterium]|nr:EamA family transporter [Stellaceae bacterium]